MATNPSCSKDSATRMSCDPLVSFQQPKTIPTSSTYAHGRVAAALCDYPAH